MKKYIAIFLSVFMIFGVSACNQQTNADKTELMEQEQIQDNNIEDETETQSDNTSDTEELAEFNITGDEFIQKMNMLLAEVNSEYKLELENFQISANTEKATTYSTQHGNIGIEYSINNNTENVALFGLMVSTKDINQEEIIKMFSYYLAAATILDSSVDFATLDEKLSLTYYSEPHMLDYESEKTYFSKMVSDENIVMLLVAHH